MPGYKTFRRRHRRKLSGSRFGEDFLDIHQKQDPDNEKSIN